MTMPGRCGRSSRNFTPPNVSNHTLALDSVPRYAVDRKDFGVPSFLVKYVLGTLRNGYLIGAFRT